MPRPRLILAIETSNPSAWETGRARPGVALGRVAPNGTLEVLGGRSLDPTRPHDDELMPEIDQLVSSLALRPRDLTDIAVSVGPGGYTAVRLAVTTAKLIAEATGARVVPVPSPVVAAWAASPSLRSRGVARFAVAISSKGETTFLTCFEATPEGAKALEQGIVIHAAELGRAMSSHTCTALLADRFLPQEIVASAARLGVDVIAPEFDPAACLRASLGLAPVEPEALLPLYAREPEAVTKWRELGKDKAARERRNS